MNPLTLYFQGANQVMLTDGDSLVQGCRYAPGTGAYSAEVVEDVVEVALAGTWALISERIRQIEYLFYLAEHQPLKKDWIYLRFYDGAAYDWKSRVLAGWVELGARGLIDRDSETQLIRLHVRRLNYWAAPKKKAVAFTNWEAEPLGRYPIDGVSSCKDATHDNGWGICGHVMDGDLPGPIEIWIENVTTADTYYDFTISQRPIAGTARLDTGFIEGEALTAGANGTKSTTQDFLCSNQYYATFSWTGSGEKNIAFWAPATADLNIMAGAVHRPILRLRDVNAAADIWACVKVLVHGTATVIAESLWSLLPTGTKYIELGAVNLPPLLEGDSSTYRGVDVALFVNKISGNGSLAIDFIQFTPAERIRRLTSVYYGMSVGAGKYLVDSGIDEETYYRDASGNRETTHIGSGKYLEVIPGCDSMVRVLHQSNGGSAWNLFVPFNFHVWYEPRRRTL